MAVRFSKPMLSIMNSAGTAVNNAGRLFFYVTGTSTKKDTYTTEALSTANANPITLDSAGRHGDIWLGSGAYKVILAGPGSDDPPASPIKTWDPEYGDGGGGSGAISLNFDTVALLKAQASASLADAQVAYVRSYYSTGPKFLGGGFFRWDDASTATQDNVIVFRPDDTGAGVAGRWFRIVDRSIAVEDGGVKDDNSTDSGAAIRAVIDAAAAYNIQKIVFLGRDTGFYVCSTPIINATTMPEGLTLSALRPRGGNDAADGCVIKYTGTVSCFDIRNALGTAEIGQWVFEDLTFMCTDAAGSAFDINYLTQAGVDYSPTDSGATPNYFSKIFFKNCAFWGPGGSSTGWAIRAKKGGELVTDQNCLVRGWKRGIQGIIENGHFGGRFIGNGRALDLRSSGTFGNNNKIDPTFIGSDIDCGEARYCFYNTSKSTVFTSCLMEPSDDADAHFYNNGTGLVLYAPHFGGNVPVWECGNDFEDMRIYGPIQRGGAPGALAPVFATPSTWESAMGIIESGYVTVYDADVPFMGAVAQHPQVRYLNANMGSTYRPGTLPVILSTGFEDRALEVLHALNFDQWAVWTGIGVTGIEGIVADATVTKGYVIRMDTTGSRGFYRGYNVGRNIRVGATLRIVVRYKFASALGAGNWAWAILLNGVSHTSGNLSSRTTFGEDVITYTLSGFVDDDNLHFGIVRASADQKIDIEAITVAIVESLPDDLTHAVGTADGTVADVTGSFDQTILNNNFKELTTDLAAIKALLRNRNIGA